MLSRLRALAVDLTPLRHRDFRLLWIGEIFSETGSSITLVAVYIQVYRLTGSAAAVGAIGLVQLVPLHDRLAVRRSRSSTATTGAGCC